jgi:hypothetical protein
MQIQINTNNSYHTNCLLIDKINQKIYIRFNFKHYSFQLFLELEIKKKEKHFSHQNFVCLFSSLKPSNIFLLISQCFQSNI